MKKTSPFIIFILLFITSYIGTRLLDNLSSNTINKLLEYRGDMQNLVLSIRNLRKVFYTSYLIGVIQVSLCVLLLLYFQKRNNK